MHAHTDEHPGRNERANDAAEVTRIAAATGFGEGAVAAMADAVRNGNGSMAQFSHPELGGFGQWSAGGMLMIGDMFNTSLKARVSTLADEVSRAYADGRLAQRAGVSRGTAGNDAWWPGDFERPSASGGQNGWRYAVFPEASRLAVERDGLVSIYETGDHRIGGVSQQQGGATSLRFTSQHGSVDLADLGEVGHDDPAESKRPKEPPTPSEAEGQKVAVAPTAERLAPTPTAVHAQPASEAQRRPTPGTGHDTVDLLRHLAQLRNEGILTDEEFAAKKAELLGRL